MAGHSNEAKTKAGWVREITLKVAFSPRAHIRVGRGGTFCRLIILPKQRDYFREGFNNGRAKRIIRGHTKGSKRKK